MSILPVASKVLEKIVYNQMHKYLEQNNLIYAFQSGFRSAHSTDTALTFLADKLRANMDEGLYTGMVLIDLQKAFDTVDYTILRPCSHHSFGTGTVPERNRAPVFTPVPLRPVVPERADHLAM